MGKFLFLFIASLLLTLVDAWIVKTIWNWYLMDLYAMTLQPAFGLAMLGTYVTFKARGEAWYKANEGVEATSYIFAETITFMIMMLAIAGIMKVVVF